MPEGESVGASGIETYGCDDRVVARGLAQIVSSVHSVVVPVTSRDEFPVEVGADHSMRAVFERAFQDFPDLAIDGERSWRELGYIV